MRADTANMLEYLAAMLLPPGVEIITLGAI